MWKLVFVGMSVVGTASQLVNCVPSISNITASSGTLTFILNGTILTNLCSINANTQQCNSSLTFSPCVSPQTFSGLNPETQYEICMKCTKDLASFTYDGVSFTTLAAPTPSPTPAPVCKKCSNWNDKSCAIDSDCSFTQTLFGGTCTGSPVCETDLNCPIGYTCNFGTQCVASPNPDCPTNTEGTCNPCQPESSSIIPTPTPTPACSTNADCDDLLPCTTDECVGGICSNVLPLVGTCANNIGIPPVAYDICGGNCWAIPVCEEVNCDCIGSCTYNLSFWRSHSAFTSCPDQIGPCQQTLPWPHFAGLSGDMENVTVCDALTAVQSLDTNHIIADSSCSLVGSCALGLFDIVLTPAAGNQWLQLLQQWILYHLNTANGRNPCQSCVTVELENADAIATSLLLQTCETGTIPNQYFNETLISIHSILLRYNNDGGIGPGKCATDDKVYCTLQPDCGCTYTRGYWQSPRFRTYPYSSKKKSTDSVKDTCNWPSNSTDHKENDLVNCGISGIMLTKWDVEHGTYKGKDLTNYGINKQWISTMAQAIAFQLNLLNGACAVGCQHSDYISGQCALIEEFYTVDVYPFLLPTGQSCKASTSTVIGTCGTACQALCAELGSYTTCNMATVLESFNNGTNGIGPGHCEATPDGNATRRGCCENCNCYSPACVPEIVYFASEPTTPESDDGLTLDEELDIAMLFFIILGALSVASIAFMLFMCVRNPDSTFQRFMGKKYDMVTPQTVGVQKFRF